MLNWNDAQKACQGLGGNLASVLSEDEEDKITSSDDMKSEKLTVLESERDDSSEWWIGLKQNDGNWEWIDQSLK